MTNEEAIKIIMGVMDNYHVDTMINRRIDDALSVAIQALKAELVKHGRWIAYEFGNERWHKCSVCGKADEYINNLGLEAVRNYCPNCGASMQSTMGQLNQEGGVNE